MTKFLIDFWMDGYESEAAMIEAAPDYIFDNLDSAGASVKVVCHIDEDNLLNEVERLRAEVARLRNELDEIRRAYTDIMNEPCEDEVHCTCVPGLRAEIVKWIAANNAATTIINEQQAEIECLRRMIQR